MMAIMAKENQPLSMASENESSGGSVSKRKRWHGSQRRIWRHQAAASALKIMAACGNETGGVK
jgi:hypothetical protein